MSTTYEAWIMDTDGLVKVDLRDRVAATHPPGGAAVTAINPRTHLELSLLDSPERAFVDAQEAS